MVDTNFIECTLQRGNEAKDKVCSAFSHISFAQLNWKPSAEEWSIAECLEHLLISDWYYFPVLKKITTGVYTMSFWEKYSPFSAWCGHILKTYWMQEQVSKKRKAPEKLQPTNSEKEVGFIDTYLKSLDRFLEYISHCRPVDLDTTIITSPTIRLVTYSLRDALCFLVQHEHRHINQAIRLKQLKGFPEY